MSYTQTYIVRPYFANIGKRLVMETAVLGEIVRTLTNRGERPQVYFWRTGPGFLIHAGQGRLPLGSGVTAAGFADL